MSTVPILNPSTVISEFQELLDQLPDVRAPCPSQMMFRMSDLCSRLKIVGSQLETSFKVELDELQNELVRLCQESFLDLELRLQILEIVELRSFGWKSNKGMEEFYTEKFNDARKAKEISMSSHETSNNTIEQVIEGNLPNETGNANEDGVTKSHLMIGTSELVLESRDRQVVQLAKQQLETFFSQSSGVKVSGGAGDNPPLRRPRRLEVEYVVPEVEGSGLKYSREAMLTIANTRHAQDAPINWSERIKELPGVILKQG